MVLPVDALRKLLASGYFSNYQTGWLLVIQFICIYYNIAFNKGRRYVTLSLAEAETLRRVLHMRKHAATYKYASKYSSS